MSTTSEKQTLITTLANTFLGKEKEKRWKRLIAILAVFIVGFWFIFCVSFGYDSVKGFWFESQKKELPLRR